MKTKNSALVGCSKAYGFKVAGRFRSLLNGHLVYFSIVGVNFSAPVYSTEY